MKLEELPIGTILHLDWRTLPKNPEGRYGRTSLVSGVPFGDGVIALRLEGNRHEAAYGPNVYLYVLTQEALDRGEEGVLLSPGQENYDRHRQSLLAHASDLVGVGVEDIDLAWRGNFEAFSRNIKQLLEG